MHSCQVAVIQVGTQRNINVILMSWHRYDVEIMSCAYWDALSLCSLLPIPQF